MMDSQGTTVCTPSSLESSIKKFRESQSPAQLVKEIEVVLETPAILVFGELLEEKNVQQLQNTEYAGYLELLKLFAYGTLRDYEVRKDRLPKLSELMTLKLRHLTVATLAAKSRSLRYSELMTELGIDNRRQLEDLIIESIYAGVVAGKLDQKNSSFEVDRSLARDVPEDISGMSRLLDDWCASCEAVLSAIERESERASFHKSSYQERMQELESRLQTIKSTGNDDSEAGSSKYKVRPKA